MTREAAICDSADFTRAADSWSCARCPAARASVALSWAWRSVASSRTSTSPALTWAPSSNGSSLIRAATRALIWTFVFGWTCPGALTISTRSPRVTGSTRTEVVSTLPDELYFITPTVMPVPTMATPTRAAMRIFTATAQLSYVGTEIAKDRCCPAGALYARGYEVTSPDGFPTMRSPARRCPAREHETSEGGIARYRSSGCSGRRDNYRSLQELRAETRSTSFSESCCICHIKFATVADPGSPHFSFTRPLMSVDG